MFQVFGKPFQYMDVVILFLEKSSWIIVLNISSIIFFFGYSNYTYTGLSLPIFYLNGFFTIPFTFHFVLLAIVISSLNGPNFISNSIYHLLSTL